MAKKRKKGRGQEEAVVLERNRGRRDLAYSGSVEGGDGGAGGGADEEGSDAGGLQGHEARAAGVAPQARRYPPPELGGAAHRPPPVALDPGPDPDGLRSSSGSSLLRRRHLAGSTIAPLRRLELSSSERSGKSRSVEEAIGLRWARRIAWWAYWAI